METANLDLKPYINDLAHMQTMRWVGEVVQVVGLLIESTGPAVAIGDFIEIYTSEHRPIRCQVVGFRDGRVLSMPLEEAVGVQLGDRVIAREEAAFIGVGRDLLGRGLGGFGRAICSVALFLQVVNDFILSMPS